MPGIYARLPELYREGKNLIEELTRAGVPRGEAVEISYDFQAGTYVEFNRQNPDYVDRYTTEIANIFAGLGPVGSMMEVGTGEATTLMPVLARSSHVPAQVFGFDLSWSRVRTAVAYAQEFSMPRPCLFVGDLFHIPMADDSIDLVFTYHCLEPNGGREEEALAELYRVCARYLVLFEPSYELATAEGRERMERLGYVKDLGGAAARLGLRASVPRLAENIDRPQNPTQIIVIEKQAGAVGVPRFVCPITHSPLQLHGGHYRDENGLFVYPVIDGVPCLTPKHRIVATRFGRFAPA